MKAWQVNEYCEPAEMDFTDVPVPKPGKGQILVRNHAVGVNFFDLLFIQGKYQAKPEFPFTPGGETAGVVEALGPGVKGFAVGDRVLANAFSGGYSEYSIARDWRASAIPANMTFAEAAGFMIVYQTSYFGLNERARLQPKEWLLVHAGASGVGMAAIQLGKLMGAHVIATAGSAAKREFCRQQGADHVLDYKAEGWVEQVKELTGGVGAGVIYDPVGGEVFELSMKCIAPGGRLLVVGFSSGVIPEIACNRVLLKNMSVVGVFWGRHVEEDHAYLQQTQDRLNAFYEQGKIRPVVSKTYPLAEAPRALADIAERRVAGKVALTVG
ncbi:MAG TPA: NADPH:quinone oxidoreductase family protein [Bryobacterales bacterium]|nr:NADPH:quinone oxidoreductase family protein [Bryobacterales bacterium]